MNAEEKIAGYKSLDRQKFVSGDYSIVPIRMGDRYDIMQWRNEQIYHLRQKEKLTKEEQDHYFENVVSKLFEKDRPDQFLFSFLKNEKCIGYGGLVHINWADHHAEISFIMDTSLEATDFKLNWSEYLSLIEVVAFKELKLHKIFVYAFDLRPHLYDVLRSCNYFLDAKLKEHCFFEGKFNDVVIYSKLNEVR
ncbi:MAG: GNAT family N-acetyltransferase [Bacteroidota bacterium]